MQLVIWKNKSLTNFVEAMFGNIPCKQFEATLTYKLELPTEV